MGEGSPAPAPRWTWALGLTVALGAALRVHDLGAESFWGDELAMALVTGRGFEALREELGRGRAPVFMLLGYVWMRAFGTTEAAARSLSALCGILSLPLLYLVGRRLLDTRLAVVATLLMAVSEFQIRYSQEYRYYALVVLVSLASMLAYLRFVEAGRRLDLVAWTLSAGALFHTHPYGLLVAAAQDLHFALALRRRAHLRRPLIVAHGALALLMLPGLLVRQLGTHTGAQKIPSWIEEPAPWQPLVTLMHFLLPAGTRPGLMVAVLALVAAGAVLWARRIDAGQRSQGVLLLCWLGVPLLLPFAASYVFTPIYVDRYVIAASPAFYLVAATALAALGRLAPLPLTLGALLLLIAPGLHSYYRTPLKEQWREAAAYLRLHASSADVLVFAEPVQRPLSRAFAWYHRDGARICSVDRDDPDPQRLWTSVQACAPPNGRLWLFERTPATLQQHVLHAWTRRSPGLTLREAARFRGVALYRVALARQ